MVFKLKEIQNAHLNTAQEVKVAYSGKLLSNELRKFLLEMSELYNNLYRTILRACSLIGINVALGLWF